MSYKVICIYALACQHCKHHSFPTQLSPMKKVLQFLCLLLILSFPYGQAALAQANPDPSLLTIDRIFNSGEFQQQSRVQTRWVENGNAYLRVERSKTVKGGMDINRFDSQTQEKTTFLSAENLLANGGPLPIEDISLSKDASKVLIFTNSSRVWRSNTKGDFWVYDLNSKKLKQLGSDFEASSLMFAKFSPDNQFVAYVHKFNLYLENFSTGEVKQLTKDGSRDIINGTFDWVYEEEFGKRDGFQWSPGNDKIAYWQLDAGDIGTFYMINNTDSIYSTLVPLQYPKVGQDPSAAKLGCLDVNTGKTEWVPLEGGEKENYIPGMQWVNDDLLLIQQINRKQNHLTVWAFQPSKRSLRKVYTEREDTWVDIMYPDISSSSWGQNDLPIVDKGKSFLRMTEKDGWRHVYKVDIASGKKKLLTKGDFDVASVAKVTQENLYFIASPSNSTQRYLYSTDIKGSGKVKRRTPETFSGLNTYNISPNGLFAVHTHQSSREPHTVSFVSLPDHKVIQVLIDNKDFREKVSKLNMPEVRFDKVTTEGGFEIDVRMVLPPGFDPKVKYPVLFHVYGEPWGQVCIDAQVGLWNAMLAQKGYVVIDMDNRGTPCLKGSAWRKSIYRKVGQINALDQAQAAKEMLKRPYLDPQRTAVWGWSGGGSMTLNLMFQYPEIYTTGIAVAAVSDQLVYDNIYLERYMGLPQENKEDFVKGSPISYAKNLEGNLLVIHGTADDNVHYQSAELLINELIAQNKQFDLMSYPNRSHGIYEGVNTRRHLYTLITNYLLEHVPVNE